MTVRWRYAEQVRNGVTDAVLRGSTFTFCAPGTTTPISLYDATWTNVVSSSGLATADAQSGMLSAYGFGPAPDVYLGGSLYLANAPVTPNMADLLAPETEGGAWNAGSASLPGYVWTYSGQRWKDVAGGTLPTSPVNPRFIMTGLDTSGIANAEVAYQENVTGTQQTLTTSIADVTSVSVTTGIQTRPTWIEWGAGVAITTAPASGRAQVLLTATDATSLQFVGSATVEILPGESSDYASIVGRRRIGATIPTSRTIKLQAFYTGTTATLKLDHGALAGGSEHAYPTYARIVTG